MRETRAASCPYSSGSEANSTTWCLTKLLPGENGTRRSLGERETASSYPQASAFPTTKRVHRSTGSKTISTSWPSDSLTPAVGICCGFWLSSSFLGGGSEEFMGEVEALQGFERIFEGHRLFGHEELDGVTVPAAAETVVGVGHWIDREGR